MNKPMQAGFILKTRFVDKGYRVRGKQVESFASYINYIDRNEAVRNDNFARFNLSSQFEKYNDYMGNPEKSSGIFTAGYDSLNKEQLSTLKKLFQTSYDNNNIMWQTVISFDNRFLAELGIYNPVTKSVDERVLRGMARNVMAETLKRENIAHSAVWSASIHYNTDNIHLHIAYTEPINTRPLKNIDGKVQPRGMFPPKTIRAMKSKAVNYLLQNEYTLVDELVRGKFVAGKRQSFTLDEKQYRDLWFRIYDNLPKDKRQWYYNMNGVQPLKPLLDSLTNKYLIDHHPKEYAEFQRLVMRQQTVYQTAYGQNSKYSTYAKGKMDDLYKRMGNAILSEMRTYHSSPYSFVERNSRQIHSMSSSSSLSKLKQSLKEAFEQTYKQNEEEHRRLEQQLQSHGGYEK